MDSTVHKSEQIAYAESGYSTLPRTRDQLCSLHDLFVAEYFIIVQQRRPRGANAIEATEPKSTTYVL